MALKFGGLRDEDLALLEGTAVEVLLPVVDAPEPVPESDDVPGTYITMSSRRPGKSEGSLREKTVPCPSALVCQLGDVHMTYRAE